MIPTLQSLVPALAEELSRKMLPMLVQEIVPALAEQLSRKPLPMFLQAMTSALIEEVVPVLVEKIMAAMKSEQVPPLSSLRRVDTLEAKIRRELNGAGKKSYCPVSVP